MKNKLIILLLLFIFMACNNSAKKRDVAEEELDKPIQIEDTELKIKTDQRIEVLYFVFLLTDYPLISRYSTIYKEAALVYFESYREHEAVVIAEGLFEQGFGADFPVNWIFQFGDFPNLEEVAKVDFPFELISSDSLELFRQSLQSFYTDTRCDSFFATQMPFLDRMVSSVKDSIERKDIIKVIEDYFGMVKEAEYTVILSPLLHQGGFSLERTDLSELYAFVGPNKVKDSIPQFDHVFLEQDMIIHEFSHNYVNPVVDHFLDQTLELEKILFPIVKDRVKKEGYSFWDSYLYELIDRSTTIRITENVYGFEAGKELLEYEKSVGFEHCEFLIDLLKEYESNREQFKTFSDFFPVIIKSLEQEIKLTKE